MKLGKSTKSGISSCDSNNGSFWHYQAAGSCMNLGHWSSKVKLCKTFLLNGLNGVSVMQNLKLSVGSIFIGTYSIKISILNSIYRWESGALLTKICCTQKSVLNFHRGSAYIKHSLNKGQFTI